MTHVSRRIGVRTLALVFMLCCLATSAQAAGGGSPTATGKGSAPGKSVTGIVLKASAGFFGGFPFMRAEEVREKIVEGKDESYFLVSLQSREDYAKGHVPGAVNIPFDEIARPGTRARFPQGKKIVLTCEDGHRSMAAALFLAQLGYETRVLSMGLSHWNGAEAKLASPYAGSAGYPVSTDAVVAQARHRMPLVAGSGRDDETAILERTRSVLAAKRSLLIDRNEVYEKAIKGGGKDYVLVSLQKPEDYAKGHVPGALNIPYSEIAKPENLAKLPRDKKIVFICYIGHWGGAAAFFLNQLGYEAYDMRFGTLGWNDQTEGLGEARDFLIALGESLSLPVESATK